MADPQIPSPAESDSGLPSNVAAGFCAIFVLLGGVIFYIIERKDLFVRHWAVQTIYFGIAWFGACLLISILSALFGHLPLIGILFFLLLGLLYLVVLCAGVCLWISGVIKAFKGERWEYPFISALGKKYFPNLT
jgi:uncharacterized membrane protein